MALYLLAGCLEYSSGGNGPDASAVGDGLYFCRAHHLWSIAGSEPPDAVLSRQDHYRSLLVPRDILSECFAFCLSVFPLFADPLRLTNVAVEDLLLRPSENIDYARLERLVKSKAVIVTGGGGSIGSEICERVVTFGATRLLVIENSEPALYAVTEALAAQGSG